MEFRIADTFTDSLARLTGDEQKGVKTAAFDLQVNPAHPSLQFHKLDKAKDRRFWSIRVNSDIRLIVHRTDLSLLLCFVGHHGMLIDGAKAEGWRRIRRPGLLNLWKFARRYRRSRSPGMWKRRGAEACFVRWPTG